MHVARLVEHQRRAERARDARDAAVVARDVERHAGAVLARAGLRDRRAGEVQFFVVGFLPALDGSPEACHTASSRAFSPFISAQRASTVSLELASASVIVWSAMKPVVGDGGFVRRVAWMSRSVASCSGVGPSSQASSMIQSIHSQWKLTFQNCSLSLRCPPMTTSPLGKWRYSASMSAVVQAISFTVERTKVSRDWWLFGSIGASSAGACSSIGASTTTISASTSSGTTPSVSAPPLKSSPTCVAAAPRSSQACHSASSAPLTTCSACSMTPTTGSGAGSLAGASLTGASSGSAATSAARPGSGIFRRVPSSMTFGSAMPLAVTSATYSRGLP